MTMFISLQITIFFIANIYAIVAQVAGPGKCPAVESMKDFNMEKFLGKWYEVSKFFTLFEIKCSEAVYIKDADQIKVINRGVERVPPPEVFIPSPDMKNKFQASQTNLPIKPTNLAANSARSRRRRQQNIISPGASDVKEDIPKYLAMGQYSIKELPKIQLVDVPTEAIATVVIPDPKEPANLVLNFTRGPQADFKIVDTDYNNFAIIWSCHDMFDGSFNAQFSSILSRQRTLDNVLLDKSKKKMSNFGIDIQRFEISDQKNCPDEMKISTQEKDKPKVP